MKAEKCLFAVVLIAVEVIAASLASAQQAAMSTERNNAEGSANSRWVGRKLTSPLDTSYEDTRRILSENNTCSRFYGGPQPAVEVLTRLVNQLEVGLLSDSRTGIQMSGAFTYAAQSEGAVEYRLFTRAIINTRGPFLKAKVFPSEPLVPSFGGLRPNTREVRVLVLLHELAHLIKGKDGRWLIPDDGHAPEISAGNTALIASHCRQQILSLSSQ